MAAIGLHQQSGVIPYRLVGDKVEILLITSIRRGRWIIPKGIVEPQGYSPVLAEWETKEEIDEVALELIRNPKLPADYFPQVFIVTDACLTNADFVWFHTHFYL